MSAAEFTLRGATPAYWNWAHHSSSLAKGTWSFDIYFMGSDGLEVWFICNDLVGGGEYNRPRYGYFIEIDQYDTDLELWRNVDDIQTRLGSYDFPGSCTGWWHIDVTRDGQGNIKVYLDDVLRVEATDTSFTTSTYFYAQFFNTQAIDNIIVDDVIAPGPIVQVTSTLSDESAPHMTLDHSGTLNLAYTYGGDVLLTTSPDGHSWSSPIYMEQGTSHEINSVDICQTSDGMFWSVISRISGGATYEDIYLMNSSDGITWSTPTPLVTTTTYDTWPRITVDLDDRLWVLYSHSVTTNVFGDWDLYVLNSADGQTWSTPTQITDESYEERWGDILVGNDGFLHVTYQRYSGGIFWLYETHSTDGTTWTEGVQVVDSSYAPIHGGSLAQAVNGTYFVVFTRHSSSQVYICTSSDGLLWSSPRLLISPTYNVETPDIVTSATWDYLCFRGYPAGQWDIYIKRFTAGIPTPHPPILITHDDDFVTQCWPGSGTPENPYRIEDLFIDLESASGSCIAIYNTRAYFIIDNCHLTGASAGNEWDYDAGIFLSNVANGKIINNKCTENNYGILIEYSNENTLTNNTLTTNRWMGILTTYSDYNTINNNTVTGHHYQGLVLDHSNDNICDNNSCYENGHGMLLSVSHNNTIINSNFILNDWGGLSLHFSRDNTVIACNFVGCGFLLGWSIYDWELQQRQISDNYVNGKPLIYRQNQISGSITGPAGQIVLLNCSNLIIADYIIENCAIGIHLVHCDNCIIENNICTNHSITGIDISYSDYNTLRNNTCNYEAGYGGVNGGIILFGQCHYNLITNNTCKGNEKGIRIHDSTRNQILDNTFADNYFGIDLDPSSGCNCIKQNRFIDNTVNALDDGFCNNMDYNYWSDYTGIDEDLDGIGDTPYYFTGMAENFDPHPLMYSFGIIAWQPTLLTLSGNFDFLEKEDVRLQLAALLTHRDTGAPISGAIVTATIYDPDGAELLTVDLIEEVPGSGVYIYRSPFTIKDLKLPKGIYLVYAEATLIDHNIIIGEAVDMLQFHIDPPGEIDTNPLTIPVWLLVTTISLAIANIGLLILYWRRQKHTRPL
jgi:parallel beta-helix repeat protein